MSGSVGTCVEVVVVQRNHINIMKDVTVEIGNEPCFNKSGVHQGSFVENVWTQLKAKRTVITKVSAGDYQFKSHINI